MVKFWLFILRDAFELILSLHLAFFLPSFLPCFLLLCPISDPWFTHFYSTPPVQAYWLNLLPSLEYFQFRIYFQLEYKLYSFY